jgi:nucleoside-diphosphate-sugar epimerase
MGAYAKFTIKPKVLIFGSNSFLAKAFLKNTTHEVFQERYFDKDVLNKSKATVIINFSLNPKYKQNKYQLQIDEDMKIVNAIKNRETHFIMLSSRLIYSPNQNQKLSENSQKGRNNIYATNKILTENLIRKNLNNLHTILRLGNVFGHELGRPTFFGLALTNLKRNNEIVMDCSLSTIRDFIPVKYFCEVLDRIISTRVLGTFNVSSGHPITVGEIASSLVKGYGRGTIISTNSNIIDPFNLDVNKIKSQLNVNMRKKDVLNEAYKIGYLLKND